jgi:hypothetical protein
MKITIDFKNLGKEEFWTNVLGYVLLAAALFFITYVFLSPLVLSLIKVNFSETKWINSIPELWKPKSFEAFLNFNFFLLFICILAYISDILDESMLYEELEEGKFPLIGWGFLLFLVQQLIFKESKEFDNLMNNLGAYFPTFMFFVKTILRRTLIINSKLNSNAEMLRELTRTDEELRLKILEKKLEELDK